MSSKSPVIQNEPLARNEGVATIRWFCEQKGFKLVTKVSKFQRQLTV